jgi:hypothetical protein
MLFDKYEGETNKITKFFTRLAYSHGALIRVLCIIFSIACFFWGLAYIITCPEKLFGAWSFLQLPLGIFLLWLGTKPIDFCYSFYGFIF